LLRKTLRGQQLWIPVDASPRSSSNRVAIMSSRFTATVALVLAAAVLLICVSPLLDLPSTTVERAHNQAPRATAVALLIAPAAVLLPGAILARLLFDSSVAPVGDSVLALTCILRC
jgi:hypothetical protein